MTTDYDRAVRTVDAALARLRNQVAALRDPAAPRAFRSERIVRLRRSPAVLYIDDDVSHASLFGDALRDALPGCTVTLVSNADDALRAAQGGAWTVAVLDLNLGHPRITGLDVLAALPSSTRVVLVTGYLRSELPEVAQRAEVDAYLTKPFPPGELARVVEGLLVAPRMAAVATER